MELVKLSKTPCGGCVLVGNHLKDLGVEHTEIDIFDDEAVEKKFNIAADKFREQFSSVPVLLLLDDDGVELARVNGFNPPAIEALLKTM